MHSFGIQAWYIASLLFVALWLPDVGEVCAQDGVSSGVQEIRQGGYVEKVDPNVDYGDRMPRITPREPAESLAAFHAIDGVRIETAACEPQVADVVDLAFDADGRLYVAEMIPYAEGNTSAVGSPDGRISLLEDTDGDGRFEKSTIFVEKLVWPTGIACFDGGLFVAAAPELLYCKDTDSDGKADVREVVLRGFDTTNPNALPNSLRFGLDNRLHGMTSTSGGLVEPVRWNRLHPDRIVAAVQSRGRDFSIDPRSGEFRLESGGGQFGMTFDDWGRKFESSNSAPCEMIMYDDHYIARNPFLAAPTPRLKIWQDGMTVYPTAPPEPWRVIRTEMRIKGSFSGPVEGGGTPAGYFTAACGLMVYKGDAFPREFRGNAFVCEGAGNLVHRMRLVPDGVGFSAQRTEQKHEFLTSDEIWFRPIQFANAPDGALYMADMYREIFEHPDAVPPSLKKHIDLTHGNDRGRIYRIAPIGLKLRHRLALSKAPIQALVRMLEHPNGWHRNTAARLLFERQDLAAIEPLHILATTSRVALARMHAMYALAGLETVPGKSALVESNVLPRLADESPRVREHAVRLAESVLANSPLVREKLYAMTDDEDTRLRYQLAFTLGQIDGIKATEALALLAKRDSKDRWFRLAVLSSSFSRAGTLFSRLAADVTWRRSPSGLILLEAIAEQAGLQNQSDQVAEVLDSLDRLPNEDNDLAQVAVRGLTRGLKQANSPLLEQVASGGRAGDALAEMIVRAGKIAEDDDKPIPERVEAIRSLSLAPFDDAVAILADLLESRQPQAVQVAAVQALGRFSEEEVAELIVEAWSGFSPRVRGEAAEALFARTSRLSTLLSAVEEEWIGPSQLDPARIQFLVSHPDASLRRRAEDLLGDVKLARREEAVEAYRGALDLETDIPRGKAIFKRECATCHKLEGVGYDLGLPLATVDSRGRDGVLLQILDPNREVNPAYLNYIVLTDEGLSVTGMITAETATSITLTRAEGESDTVLRTNIDELQSTGLSIMPEGLEEQITKQEMADLIEYLMRVP